MDLIIRFFCWVGVVFVVVGLGRSVGPVVRGWHRRVCVCALRRLMRVI